ncbi:MAG: polysaccharide deacetylase family protein, partial [Pseudonocardiaceae bacterium]
GENEERFGEQKHSELEAGHAVANHSYNHRKLSNVSQQVFDSEVDRTQNAIGPRAAKCLRPPYGALNTEVRERAAAKGLSTVLWDVDTLDWKRGPVTEIVDRVKSHAETGTIVLMHDGGGNRSQTLKALEIVLRDMTAEGWSFASLCS